MTDKIKKDDHWYQRSWEEVVEKLDTSLNGLSSMEALKRLKTFGENKLPEKKQITVYQIFFSQFFSPLIYILIAAGIVASVLQEFTDAAFIFGVIFLNAFLGTYQEAKAEKNANELQKLLKVNVQVRREDKMQEIDSEKLVPGDIVYLESGQKVPADLRLISVKNFSADESFLTGESEAIQKVIEIVAKSDAPVHDQKNMVFAGATVMTGRAMGVVVATGMKTAVGAIADALLEEDTSKPPLIIRMERFSKHISYFVLGAVLILAAIALAQNMSYHDVFFLSVALAVSAIPEGLPIAMTVALSIATKRMALRRVIVRKLAAVESLGSCTMIASDKTGTLTVNRQTLKKIVVPYGKKFEVTGEGYEPKGKVVNEDQSPIFLEEKEAMERMAEAVAICNEGTLIDEDGVWRFQGDAIDIAFLTFAYKVNDALEALNGEVKITGSIDFESEKQFAAVSYQEGNENFVAVKGAVEKILPFCNQMAGEHKNIPLDVKTIEAQVLTLSQAGYRVLGVASGEYLTEGDLTEDKLQGLTFLGLAGFIDPLRSESKESIQKARNAGIEVAMITGDHPATALAISKELGIAQDERDLMTGNDFKTMTETLSEDEIKKELKNIRVFARVTPLQKLKIVEYMMANGHFVAVTGDGVNDAPALKKAHIGVAMGSGSDVAKDTAEILAVDDNFSSILQGIEEGRYAYSNVRKVIYLLIATGAAEIILFVLSLLFGLPLPLLAVQLLWLNLVTNGIQDVALGFEGGEPGEMKKPPRRPKEGIFNSLMIQQVLVSGATIGLLAFGVWYYLMSVGMETTMARNIVLMLMVLLENIHAFNCRSEEVSVFKIPFKRNYVLIYGVLAAQMIHIISLNLPLMQKILDVQPIPFSQWIYLLGLSVILLVIMEGFKKIRIRR